MEPDGILNACTTQDLMMNVRTSAQMIDSAYSRIFDFSPDAV